MTRRASRTQPCSRAQALTRIDNARKSLEVAELASSEQEIPASRSVAAALAVLSGIASSDAACCAAFGRRARGEDHREAVALLRQVGGGNRAAKSLAALLDLKDTAHYGLINVSTPELKRASRNAKALIDFADQVVRR